MNILFNCKNVAWNGSEYVELKEPVANDVDAANAADDTDTSSDDETDTTDVVTA